VAYSAAIKGDIANQKAVIAFVRDPKGPDTVYRMDLPGKLSEIRTNLDAAGLQYRTLIPTDAGAHVVLYDQGSALRANVEKLGEHYENLSVASATGIGSFIGGDTREEGHAAYQRVISGYEQGHDQGRYKRLDSTPIDRNQATDKGKLKTIFGGAVRDAMAGPDAKRSLGKLSRKLRLA
jgi:hypothetical protein